MRLLNGSKNPSNKKQQKHNGSDYIHMIMPCGEQNRSTIIIKLPKIMKADGTYEPDEIFKHA